jgi:hypothetical protein
VNPERYAITLHFSPENLLAMKYAGAVVSRAKKNAASAIEPIPIFAAYSTLTIILLKSPMHREPFIHIENLIVVSITILILTVVGKVARHEADIYVRPAIAAMFAEFDGTPR